MIEEEALYRSAAAIRPTCRRMENTVSDTRDMFVRYVPRHAAVTSVLCDLISATPNTQQQFA